MSALTKSPKVPKSQKRAANIQAQAATDQLALAKENAAQQKAQFEETSKILQAQVTQQSEALAALSEQASTPPATPDTVAAASGAGVQKALIANRRRAKGLSGLILTPLGGGSTGGRSTLGA